MGRARAKVTSGDEGTTWGGSKTGTWKTKTMGPQWVQVAQLLGVLSISPVLNWCKQKAVLETLENKNKKKAWGDALKVIESVFSEITGDLAHWEGVIKKEPSQWRLGETTSRRRMFGTIWVKKGVARHEVNWGPGVKAWTQDLRKKRSGKRYYRGPGNGGWARRVEKVLY